LEDVWERRSCERSVEERRGRVATVWVAILRIYPLWKLKQTGRLDEKDAERIVVIGVVEVRRWVEVVEKFSLGDF
jgi:hypothetical protein